MYYFIENRQSLLKTLDQLTNMEVTREELLEQDICEVDTTTPTPSPQKSKAMKVTKTMGEKSTTKTAKSTPKTAKSTPKTAKSTPKTAKMTPKIAKGTPKTAKIEAAKERARQLFQHKLYPSPTVAETSSSADLVVQLQKELAALKNKLESNQAEAGRYN